MRFMSFVVLLAYFIASLLPDVAAMFVGQASQMYSLSPSLRKALALVANVPYQAFIFGVTYSLATIATAEQHRRPPINDVLAFVFICALIFIISQYGGVFVAPTLDTFHINPYIFFRTVQALMLAFVAWKGLQIPLGGLGVFLTSLLALGMAASAAVGLSMPLNFEMYWFTIIGTFMGLFAAFSRS